MLQKIRPLVALVAIALTLCSFIRPAVISAEGVPDATVATALLRIRATPTRNGAVVAMVPKGTAIKLDGRNKFGTWVHGSADTGAVGWISRPYLAIRKGFSVLDLPVTDSAPSSAGSSAPAQTNNNTNPANPANPPSAPIAVSGRIGGGFEIGGQVQGLDGGTISAMQRAGMHWVKWQLGVGDNGTGAINSSHAAGFRVLLSVKGDKNSVLNAGYFDQYAGYVGTLAKQGADAIEVWNEANLDREWPYGQVNPATYTQLLAKAYNAIKSNNSNTIVVSGAPSPTGGAPGGKSAAFWNDDVYYAGMAAAGAGKYSDCIGVHYNEGIVSPNQTSGGWINYPTNYFDTMLNRALAAFPGKKACFTELGFVSSEGFGYIASGFSWARNVTVGQQAAWLAQAAVRASKSNRVRLMIVWNVNLKYYGPDDPQAGYAIIRPDGSCPACDTLGAVSH